MTARSTPPQGYPGAPALQTPLLLGSLQLLGWLFCHPTAWRQYVAHLDPMLRPTFVLLDVHATHWRSPVFRRLLLMTCLARSLYVALPVGIVLALAQVSVENLAFGVALGVAVALAGGLAADVVIGVAPGLTGGWVGGIVGGVGYGLAGTAALEGIFASGFAGVVALGLAACLGLGMGGSIAGSLSSRQTVPAWGQHVGVVVLGILIGGVIYGTGFAIALGLAGGTVGSLAFGLVAEVEVTVAFGVAVGWRTRCWQRGLGLGLGFLLIVLSAVAGVHGAAASLAPGVVYGVALGCTAGIADSMLLCAICALPYVLAEDLVDTQAGAVAGVLGSGVFYIIFATAVAQTSPWVSVPLGLVCCLAGLTVTRWRPWLVYPLEEAWALVLWRTDERRPATRPSLLRWHPVFWDEYQRWRLWGLDEHLVLLAERRPAEGQAALAAVTTSPQRWAAQAAQIELEARQLARCQDLAHMRQAHRHLAAEAFVGPASTLLRSFSRLSQNVDAALHQSSLYHQRLALRGVEEVLDAELRALTRSHEPYVRRFYPLLLQWRQQLAEAVQAITDAATMRQEIDSPYVLGVPLTMHQAIFVGRTDVSARLELLLADHRCPPLLLYGQRRMGKTSLLNNLGRLLPTTIVPLFVDLQGPASQASQHAGFLYNLARSMGDSARRQREFRLPPLARETLTAEPFTAFDEWLDAVEAVLAPHTVLLALDEFEALDQALDNGRFSAAAVLGMLRHLIQHRPRFKVLLAGSHALDELHRWSHYLINVQVIHLGYLSEGAARQLIEHPVEDFALRYTPEASQRVLDLTHGHPFLVQLLCAEIVALKNEQDLTRRRLACLADVEAAVPEALQHGALFFADIAHHQVDTSGLAVLRALAAQGAYAVVERHVLARTCPRALEQTLAVLVQREVLEPVASGYRFQVELVRRWFASEP